MYEEYWEALRVAGDEIIEVAAIGQSQLFCHVV